VFDSLPLVPAQAPKAIGVRSPQIIIELFCSAQISLERSKGTFQLARIVRSTRATANEKPHAVFVPSATMRGAGTPAA
jgi:hypothetical protein